MTRHARLTMGGGAAAMGLAALALAGCSGHSGRYGASAAHQQASASVPSATIASQMPSGAAQPATAVRGEATALGQVLADAAGLTLYTFSHDQGGTSTCTGPCAVAWPPLTVATGGTVTGPGGTQGKLGTITRPGGGRQITFDGHPLYSFSGDSAPGQTHGQGLDAAWYVIKLPTAAVASPPSAVNRAPAVIPPMTGHSATAPTHAVSTPPVPVPPRPAPISSQPRPVTTPTNCIPQRGGGDGDGDNSGGGSDGDGCT